MDTTLGAERGCVVCTRRQRFFFRVNVKTLPTKLHRVLLVARFNKPRPFPVPHLPVEVVGPVRITKVAKEVLLPQMSKQFVLVQEPFVAVLAQGMTPMADVVRIANPPMDGQVLPTVTPALR